MPSVSCCLNKSNSLGWQSLDPQCRWVHPLPPPASRGLCCALHAGAGGADESHRVRGSSLFKWMKSNWIEALILSPKEKERVLGTILDMAEGTVFAFSEVNGTPFPLCVFTGFVHPVGCELHFILMASPGNRKVCLTSSSRK